MKRPKNSLFPVRCSLLLAVLLLISGRARAQAIDQQLAAYDARTLVEKVYLHADRPAYLAR